MSCPFASSSLPTGHNSRSKQRTAPKGYLEAFAKIDFDEVREDLTTLMTDSKDFWPADYGNYGPLMIRLAWHAAGSYRTSDGRGGADGGRLRFDPERSWDDNTNLDKARKLLEPIKKKYGLGLSWGDLIVLAGDTAIKSMGGPIIGFCGGRIDDETGFWSERLGPNAEQKALEPCADEEACTHPFGANKVGLIYVNPQGPKGHPDPAMSAEQVRSTFGRMGMNDVETVALVGGGHAFGKSHGPAAGCGAGAKPKDTPLNAWRGDCGSGATMGIAENTFTSGFEGPWTTNPDSWDNQYFTNLRDYTWEKYNISSGATQWRVTADASPRPQAPDAHTSGKQDIMMTTADVSLKIDANYSAIVNAFADDATGQAYLDEEFGKAWYKLMTRDMGPVSRCLGKDLPMKPQAFQDSLPGVPKDLADFDAVRKKLVTLLTTENSSVLALESGETYGPLMVRLAWRCAGTFRVSDYNGGCNGARIRGEPQASWPVNMGLDKALQLLEPIKTEFGEGLSWADLIVLAGTTALEEAGAPKMTFCGGRVDFDISKEDVVSPALAYLNDENLVRGKFEATIDDMEQYSLLLNLNAREYTALMGGLSLGDLDLVPGFEGKRTANPEMLGSEYFENLLSETWDEKTLGNGEKLYTSGSLNMLRSDLLLVASAETLSVVQDYAGDKEMYLEDLSNVWTKMMNADRFNGPTGNLCESQMTKTEVMTPESDKTEVSSMLLFGVIGGLGFLVVVLLTVLCCRCSKPKSEEEREKHEMAYMNTRTTA